MLKLHYMKGACSLVPHIALVWSGAKYETKEWARPDLKSPEYLALNPQGSVPLLQDGDWAVSQNIAIIQYINDTQNAQLFGKGDVKTQAKARQWLAFANSDIHRAFGGLFNPAQFCANESAHPQIRESAVKKVSGFYQIAENILKNQDYLSGEFTIADVYLYVTLRWAKGLKLDLSAFEALARFYERVENQSVVQQALKEEGLI